MFKKTIIALALLNSTLASANPNGWYEPPHWFFTFVSDNFNRVEYNQPQTPIDQWRAPTLTTNDNFTMKIIAISDTANGEFLRITSLETSGPGASVTWYGFPGEGITGSVKITSRDGNDIPTDWEIDVSYSSGSPWGGGGSRLVSSPDGSIVTHSSYWPTGGDPWYHNSIQNAYALSGTWSVTHFPGYPREPEIPAIPEPSTNALLLAGIGFVALASRRKRYSLSNEA